MKKIITLFVVMLCSFSLMSAASIDKSAMKFAQKEAKKVAKALLKDGWTYTSLGPLEIPLCDHLYLINMGTHEQVISEARAPHRALAEKSAQQRSIESVVEYLLDNVSLNENLSRSQGVEVVVDEVQSCIKPSFILYKQYEKGYICRVYVLVDKEKAATIQLKPSDPTK